MPKFDLTGRQAKCTCGEVRPSSYELGFFEYNGPGSAMKHICKHCRYHQLAHSPEHMAKNVPSNRRTVIERGLCKGFEPSVAAEFDLFFCGHLSGQ